MLKQATSPLAPPWHGEGSRGSIACYAPTFGPADLSAGHFPCVLCSPVPSVVQTSVPLLIFVLSALGV
jgi:hypothetical protein